MSNEVERIIEMLLRHNMIRNHPFGCPSNVWDFLQSTNHSLVEAQRGFCHAVSTIQQQDISDTLAQEVFSIFNFDVEDFGVEDWGEFDFLKPGDHPIVDVFIHVRNNPIPCVVNAPHPPKYTPSIPIPVPVPVSVPVQTVDIVLSPVDSTDGTVTKDDVETIYRNAKRVYILKKVGKILVEGIPLNDVIVQKDHVFIIGLGFNAHRNINNSYDIVFLTQSREDVFLVLEENGYRKDVNCTFSHEFNGYIVSTPLLLADTLLAQGKAKARGNQIFNIIDPTRLFSVLGIPIDWSMENVVQFLSKALQIAPIEIKIINYEKKLTASFVPLTKLGFAVNDDGILRVETSIGEAVISKKPRNFFSLARVGKFDHRDSLSNAIDPHFFEDFHVDFVVDLSLVGCYALLVFKNEDAMCSFSSRRRISFCLKGVEAASIFTLDDNTRDISEQHLYELKNEAKIKAKQEEQRKLQEREKVRLQQLELKRRENTMAKDHLDTIQREKDRKHQPSISNEPWQPPSRKQKEVSPWKQPGRDRSREKQQQKGDETYYGGVDNGRGMWDKMTPETAKRLYLAKKDRLPTAEYKYNQAMYSVDLINMHQRNITVKNARTRAIVLATKPISSISPPPSAPHDHQQGHYQFQQYQDLQKESPNAHDKRMNDKDGIWEFQRNNKQWYKLDKTICASLWRAVTEKLSSASYTCNGITYTVDFTDMTSTSSRGKSKIRRTPPIPDSFRKKMTGRQNLKMGKL
eukprot:m.110080 g.110080  ORF g.110080 m.110080 type:complete len:743 (-) comp9215_c0_seq1:92-2320(-)